MTLTGQYQEGGKGAQGKLDLTLIPRSVGSSEVTSWGHQCHMSVTGCDQGFAPRSRKESVSFL